MKRIIKLLVVSALMMVLMASTAVSPAFANSGNGWGGKGDGPQGYGKVDGENNGCENPEQPQSSGWQAGKCYYKVNYNK